MRAERDVYKACLQAAGLSLELAKKDKDKPRPLRPSASNITMSTTSENGSLDPRAAMVRHLSDTPGVYSLPHPPVSYNSSFPENTAPGSRADDRPITPPHSQDVNGRDLQTPHPNGSANISLSPVVVPPRSVSLPHGNSSTPSNPLSSPAVLSSRLNEAEKAYTRVPTSVANNSGSPIPHGRSSQQNTIPSNLPIDANGFPGSQPQPPFIQHTPNTAVSPQAPVPGIHHTSLAAHSSSGLSSGSLSPIPEISNPVNRDSSVSLPDEAKRYIANMAEGPLQRSGSTAALLTSGPAQAQMGQGANGGRDSLSTLGRAGPRPKDDHEFFDTDEEEDGFEETEQQQQPLLTINRHDKPANMDDLSMSPSPGPIQVHQPSHTQSASSQSIPNSGSHLPPASEAVILSQTRWQAQPDISVLSQSQSSLESTPLTPQPDSPFPESYLSLTKSMGGTSSDGPNPSFRALPLIADDLKTTRVMVSHSSIRPNDRGKEVLSFQIEVDPGKGKEPWKIEKLYSDVLGLDHRLRAVVGKSVSKKIAALPEGKLWRDHAPAKSDQRKVSKTRKSKLYFFWRLRVVCLGRSRSISAIID